MSRNSDKTTLRFARIKLNVPPCNVNKIEDNRIFETKNGANILKNPIEACFN